MKKIFISLFVILLTGCSNQPSKPMTDNQKETIKSEVKKEFYAMVDACNKADLNTALNLYWNSPDFMGISSDGSIVDYPLFKKANEDYFGAIRSQKFVTIKEDIKLLNDSLILYVWQGSNEAILKTGEKMSFSSFGVTSLFKRIDGFWKIFYFQESGMPPVVTK